MTRPKPTSEFILASEAGDPVLVWWRYGLGMTVAFTSDANSRWAAEWLTWPSFGPFWAQVVRHAMRKSESKGVFVEVQRHDERAHVAVDSVDVVGQYINGAKTRMTLIRPNLERQDIELAQTAPGRYEAEFDTPRGGAYHLELSQEKDGAATFRQTRGVVVGYPDELRLGPPDDDLMRRIAAVSGGRFAPKAAEVFNPGGRVAERITPLWPYLLMAALVVFLFDVALRRIDFSLWRSRPPTAIRKRQPPLAAAVR
jgi:hypothetical protein